MSNAKLRAGRQTTKKSTNKKASNEDGRVKRSSGLEIPSDLTHPLWHDYGELCGDCVGTNSDAKAFLSIVEESEYPKALRLIALAELQARPAYASYFAPPDRCWPWTYRIADEELLDRLAKEVAATRGEVLDCLEWAAWRARCNRAAYKWPRTEEIHPRIRSLVLHLSKQRTAALIGLGKADLIEIHPTPWEEAKDRVKRGNTEPDSLDYLAAFLDHLVLRRDVLVPDFDQFSDPIPLSGAAFQYPDPLVDRNGKVRRPGVAAEEGTLFDVALKSQCYHVFCAAQKQWAFLCAQSAVAELCERDLPETPIDRFLHTPGPDAVRPALLYVTKLEARIPPALRESGKLRGEDADGRGQSPGDKPANAEEKVRPRGRRPKYDEKKDQELVDAWRYYHEHGGSREDFAKERDITIQTLWKTIDRVRRRAGCRNK